MTGTRAVITGIGVATPLGVGADELWSRLVEGSRELRPPTGRAGVPLPARAGVFAPEFEAERWFEPRALRKISNLSRLTTVATALAFDAAGLARGPGTTPGDALVEGGCVLGTTFGSSSYHLDYHERLRREGFDAGGALLFTQSVFNAPAGHASQVFGMRGPSLALVGGESVGLEAIQLASDRLRLGSAPFFVAGGGDESSDLVCASARAMGLVADDFGPDGALPFVEGACALVLEDPAFAHARGAPTRGAVLGTAGVSAGGTERLARAARLALADAGVGIEALDLVVLGTCGAGGSAEARALANAWPDAAEAAWTAPKSVVGEGFAFTSALAAAVAVLARERGVVPPTRDAETVGPELADRFRARADPRTIEHVLVAWGTSRGSAAALVVGPESRA